MKLLITTLFLIYIAVGAQAQEFGVSFSYFIPKNGYFSTPVSPFSIRGIGFDISPFLAIETGATLYRMSGLNVKDMPFSTKDPVVGPNFTIFVPVELVIQLQGQRAGLDIKGGVFGFYGFSQKIMYGNLDRAISAYEQWEVANSEVTFHNKPGYGFHGGLEVTFYLTQQFGISLESNYLVGESDFPMEGSYKGGNTQIETRQLNLPDAKIDLTGLEFSIGLIFAQNQGPARPKQKRRR